MKIFFISDTHFCHQNIIHYDQRPWNSLEEMHRDMILRWNARVSAEDVVYHGGDVSLGGIEKTLEILNQLNGTKYLTRGNHDTKHQIRNAFVSCEKQRFLNVGGFNIFMTHVPHGNWPGKKDGVIHLHGHSHGKGERRIKDRYDISCNLWGYQPVSLEEIMRDEHSNVCESLEV